MPPEDIVTRLGAGFATLFGRDASLFDLGMDGVNEQTITFRLGHYLQHLFRDHHVDCEYNRYYDGKKGCEYTGISWMKPDVIVHRRGSDQANLVCIEAKKDGQWSDGYADVEKKLLALTRGDGNYRYALGLAWRMAPSPDPARHEALWFRNGTIFHESTLAGFEPNLIQRLRPPAG